MPQQRKADRTRVALNNGEFVRKLLDCCHAGDSRLAARTDSYEMAARLQLSAPEVLNLSTEWKATRELYGLTPR